MMPTVNCKYAGEVRLIPYFYKDTKIFVTSCSAKIPAWAERYLLPEELELNRNEVKVNLCKDCRAREPRAEE